MPSPSSKLPTHYRVATLLALFAALSAATVCADDAAAAAVTRGVDACRALGFDADVLDCRRCDELLAFLTNDTGSDDKPDMKKKTTARAALDADCRACCTDVSALDLAKGAHQYDRVVLEVCTCKFGRYPKVANFVHYHAEKHAKLEIEYINARHPFLIFYDAEGNKKEEIGIASWDEETISEFIVAKLKRDDAESQIQATSVEVSVSDEENAGEGAIDEPLEALDGEAEQQEGDAQVPAQKKGSDEL